MRRDNAQRVTALLKGLDTHCIRCCFGEQDSSYPISSPHLSLSLSLSLCLSLPCLALSSPGGDSEECLCKRSSVSEKMGECRQVWGIALWVTLSTQVTVDHHRHSHSLSSTPLVSFTNNFHILPLSFLLQILPVFQILLRYHAMIFSMFCTLEHMDISCKVEMCDNGN